MTISFHKNLYLAHIYHRWCFSDFKHLCVYIYIINPPGLVWFVDLHSSLREVAPLNLTISTVKNRFSIHDELLSQVK